MKKYRGLLVALLFFCLLLLKLDIQLRLEPGSWREGKMSRLPPTEYWMAISQGNKTIGLVHRLFSQTDEGYRVKEEMFLRIKTMGIPQDIKLYFHGTADASLKLKKFEAQLFSSLYQTKIVGEVKNKHLLVNIGGKDAILPVKDSPVMVSGLCLGSKQGRVPLFDALTGTVEEAEVAYLGEEVREVASRQGKLTRMRLKYSGIEEILWCNENGEVVREEGPLGFVVERISKDKAEKMQKEMKGEVDVTQLAAIPSNVTIRDPSKLKKLTCRLEGVEGENLFLPGDRQKLQGHLLVIERENLSARRGQIKTDVFPNWALNSTPFIPVGHPELKMVVEKTISPSDIPVEKARRIVQWVYRTLEKWPVASLADGVSILKRRRGDCTEHAILVAALGRTAGLPTAVETGLVYREGKFFYHAWNAFYFDDHGWVTADAVFNQFPADCTHIRFSRGDFGKEISPLANIIGKLKITIVGIEYDRS
ncbi:MAG: transglutaminase-like domain-containing protein [Syntrophales bacterium]|nr:transglutaminase-like domain-containing protein [Syntrophales bacterium]